MSEASSKPKKIIVIDDESMTLKMTKESLERLGFVVAIFSKAQEALDYYLKNKGSVDLILSDKSMPRMTGLEFTRKVREHDPDIPILILTGYASNEDDVIIKNIGVTKVLFKPISMRELAEEMNQVIMSHQ